MKRIYCYLLFFIFTSELLSRDGLVYIWNPHSFKFEVLASMDRFRSNFKVDVSDVDSISKYVSFNYDLNGGLNRNILIFFPNGDFDFKKFTLKFNPITEFCYEEDSTVNLITRMFDTIPRPYKDLMPNGETILIGLDSNLRFAKKLLSKRTKDFVLNGLKCSYYENGAINGLEYYDMGFPDSMFAFYESGEIMSEDYYYKNTGFVQKCRRFRLNGELSYFMDSELGLGVFFHLNNSIENFFQVNKYGQVHGLYFYYDENGFLKCKSTFSYGLMIEENCKE